MHCMKSLTCVGCCVTCAAGCCVVHWNLRWWCPLATSTSIVGGHQSAWGGPLGTLDMIHLICFSMNVVIVWFYLSKYIECLVSLYVLMRLDGSQDATF